MHRERYHLLGVLVALVLGACGSEPKPLEPALTLGMTLSEFEKQFPRFKTSGIGDGWDGNVASITVKDHSGEHILIREGPSEVSVGFYFNDATTHIRPLARRPLREVIAYLEKDIPALLGKAGWKEVHSLADHWNSVYEYKCGPGDRYKHVRWEFAREAKPTQRMQMEVSAIAPDLAMRFPHHKDGNHGQSQIFVPSTASAVGGEASEASEGFANDQIEFGIMCDSLDLDSPAGAFITIRSGGDSIKTTPAH